jgi:peptidoglycan/LPS O-acetylase OafA/YrhL
MDGAQLTGWVEHSRLTKLSGEIGFSGGRSRAASSFRGPDTSCASRRPARAPALPAPKPSVSYILRGLSSSPAGRSSIRHVPALDGLRGAALLGVLFFHANGALPGGYLGVDLFFVLSGFLITSLLLAEHRDTGRIALSSFWVRRARRLFPALLSLMPAVAVYSWFFAGPGELPGLRADALATLAYVANWRAVFSHKSYWELFATPSLLEHTWSLAIEEQFYVVWPLVVVLVLRRRTSRSILALALGLTALSMAAMLALFDPAQVSRVYLGTDTRAAGILAGAALATVLSPSTTFQARTVRLFDVLGTASLLGLGVAWWKLSGESPFLYRGGFWLTEIAVLVLVVCAVMGRRSLVARALSFRPLTLVGTISYGVYLWHWPVNVFFTTERVHLSGLWLHVLQFATTFAIAIVSYHLLEQPIRRGGVPFGRPVYMVPAAVALTVLLVVRATYARPLPPPPPLPPAPAVVTFRIALFGDSTANSLGWGLRGARKPGVGVELLGLDGCTMLWDTCGGPQWAQQRKDLHPDATLVFLGGAFLHGLTTEGGWYKSCHPAWNSKFQGTLTRGLEALNAEKGPLWAVTVPYPLGPYDNATYRAEVDCLNASIRAAAASVPGVQILDLAERVCPKGVCEREIDGVAIRPDGVHYSMEGGTSVAGWVLEQIQR